MEENQITCWNTSFRMCKRPQGAGAVSTTMFYSLSRQVTPLELSNPGHFLLLPFIINRDRRPVLYQGVTYTRCQKSLQASWKWGSVTRTRTCPTVCLPRHGNPAGFHGAVPHAALRRRLPSCNCSTASVTCTLNLSGWHKCQILEIGGDGEQ